MELKVLVPYGVMTAKADVIRLVVETRGGSYGFWPDRLDCGAALAAGILMYESRAEGVVYIAIDEGVVVKTGRSVFVSARNAIRGKELGKLREAVEHEFVDLEEREKNVRAVLSKLESGFIRNFQELINK
jgi:F-type H+-transporting ATPase subunit epsilon